MKQKIRKKKKKLTYALLRKLSEQGNKLAQCFDEITFLTHELPAREKREAIEFVSFVILEKNYDIRE
jgi:hypothetical protein